MSNIKRIATATKKRTKSEGRARLIQLTRARQHAEAAPRPAHFMLRMAFSAMSCLALEAMDSVWYFRDSA